MIRRCIVPLSAFLFLLSACDKSGQPPAPPAQDEKVTAAQGASAGPAKTADSRSVAAEPGKAPPPMPANATKLPSGLEFAILKAGDGGTPPPGVLVTLHVKGWLPDGRVFMDTGAAPVEYKLDPMVLIPGWVETLLAMKKGERRRIHVPSALAYGAAGYGKDVPPRADLDFELELVDFKPPAR